MLLRTGILFFIISCIYNLSVQAAFINTISCTTTDTICSGQRPDPIIGTKISCSPSTIFRWQSKTESSTWNYLEPSDTLENYSPGSLDSTTYFRRIVQCGAIYDTSNTLAIKVFSNIIRGNIIGDPDRICYNQNSQVLVGYAMITGGNGEYDFRWQYSLDSNSWFPALNTESYNPGALKNTTFYRRIVSSSVCYDTSNVIKISVIPQIFNVVTTTDQSICEGTTIDSLQGIVAKGGLGLYVYQWEMSADKTTWYKAPYASTNEDYLYPDEIYNKTYFRRKVSSTKCETTSSIIAISIETLSNNIISNGTVINVCQGIPFTVSGETPVHANTNFIYKWHKSRDYVTWDTLNVPSSVSATLSEITENIFIRREVIFGKGCSDISNIVFAAVRKKPNITHFSSDTSLCSGDLLPLSIAIKGFAPFNVHIEDSIYTINDTLRNVFYMPLVNTSSSIKSFNIKIDSISSTNSCVQIPDTLNNTTAKVYARPSPQAGPDKTICGNNTVLNAVESNYSGTWISNNDVNISNINSAVSPVSSNEYSKIALIWQERNGICSENDTTEITFYYPVQANTGNDTTIFISSSFQLDAGDPAPGTGYWSIAGNNISIDDSTLHDAVLSDFDIGAYTLYWNVVNGTCSSSDTFKIIFTDVKAPNGFSPNGDNINDAFVLSESSNIIRFIVFDTWGNIVFEAKDYKNDWTGTDKNGNALPDGTYYYIAEADKIYKSVLIIKR